MQSNSYPLLRTKLLSIFIFMFCTLIALGAQQSPRNMGSQDTDVPSPQVTNFEFGHFDAKGLGELRANAELTGFSAWRGMIGSGTITFAGIGEADQATLSMLPGNRARLEVTTPESKSYITVVNGDTGHAKYGDGPDQGLLGVTAKVGIAPLDLPYRATLESSQYVVVDQGIVTIGNKNLHRVTVEVDLSTTLVLPGTPTRTAVDCYFDPITHLLAKTASFVLLPGAGRHRLLRVTTYGNYTISEGISVPKAISETLDGMPTWSLSLTSIDLINVPKPEIF